MPMYDYKCADGHVSDRWYPTASDADDELPCQTEDCTLTSKKIPFGLPAYMQSQKKFTGGLRVKSFTDGEGKTHRL